MHRLNFYGFVRLYTGEDENDFEKYGISVFVRYRDQEATAELEYNKRSVATMIYIIALQKLTAVPFRVVDEINQVSLKLHSMQFKLSIPIITWLTSLLLTSTGHGRHERAKRPEADHGAVEGRLEPVLYTQPETGAWPAVQREVRLPVYLQRCLQLRSVLDVIQICMRI